MNATPTNDLRHLFDGTHCLSKRQLRDYAASSMSREEAYAVESHLNTCPLCSAAVDGMLAHFPESADVLATVDAGFLKEHFKKHSPQIHLNTVAPAAATAPVTRRIPGSTRVIDLTAFRTVGIAAAVVLLIGSLWWFQNRGGSDNDQRTSAPIAQAEGQDAAPSSSTPSSMPEAERRLTGAIADDEAPRPQPQAATASEAEKSTEELLVEADDAVGKPAALSAMAPPNAKPAPAVADAKSDVTADDNAVAANETASRDIGDVNVRARRYERPLIEPKQPGSRTVLTDKEIEKMPTRSPLDAASTAPGVYKGRSSSSGMNIGGGRSENTVYVVDGIKQVGNGKELYKKGDYAAALKIFKQQMESASGATREEATLYAARCHRALGQEKAAEKLLKSLTGGTGARARAARRELRDMDGGYEESPSRRAKANKE